MSSRTQGAAGSTSVSVCPWSAPASLFTEPPVAAWLDTSLGIGVPQEVQVAVPEPPATVLLI